MMLFWVTAAVFLIIAVLFILLPIPRLNRRLNEASQQQQAEQVARYQQQLAELDSAHADGQLDSLDYEEQKNALGKRLLADYQQVKSTRLSTITWLAGGSLPVAAIGLYLLLGGSQQLAFTQELKAIDWDNASGKELVNSLETLAADYPNQPQVHYLLARTYMAMNQLGKAEQAFTVLKVQAPDDPSVIAQLAQVKYLRQNNKITQEVTTLAQQALTIQPNQPTALGIMGIAAFESGDYQQAIHYWQQVLATRPDHATATALQQGIAKAQQLASTESAPSKPQEADKPASKQVDGEKLADAEISVLVELDETLLQQLPKQAKVYVLAKHASMRMPVAVVPLQISELPALVKLNDSKVMIAGNKLSQYQMVDVIAKISISGDATQSDYVVSKQNIKVNHKGVVRLAISKSSS
ncbi:c-type cytochrome biogenesis protein CcmI [Endozoicomonas sp. SM1973]|uniref:C-type cytochrome biogenesis protein CcmI n=1 Tax=Spartinivicinus marinus TaxID=2994442 RepID=A0A853I7B8_9GAMM|nr:c-type cytochrome biogenesis protein CcmI [Spartinivicinus marinus]MCX4028960.1 c-type cytochrome biogenesis protein CcmI [Spartinivicinus marinus]NYZ65457.1 c-type cytochrome biogenesis protein CcmI [Spartinivicinus marinus]